MLDFYFIPCVFLLCPFTPSTEAKQERAVRVASTPLTALPLSTAVRYGRVPKRSRERAESLESTGSADGVDEVAVEVDPAVEQQQLLDMIAGVTAAHRAHCNYTEEATRDTVRRPAGQPLAQARPRVSVSLNSTRSTRPSALLSRETPRRPPRPHPTPTRPSACEARGRQPVSR